ncbi:MAG: hypothetical protein ACYCTV_08945 [Leptospirales bacterium]
MLMRVLVVDQSFSGLPSVRLFFLICFERLQRTFFSLACLFMLAGCASLSTSTAQDHIWQSDPREPVWVYHSLPPVNGNIFVVQSGISFNGVRNARKIAVRKVAGFLLDRLKSFGMKFTDAGERRLRRRFETEIEQNRRSLALKDHWEYKRLPNSDNPFRVESHAWVLVGVSVHFLTRLRHELMIQDRERFRRIQTRHSRTLRLLKRFDGTSALLLLSHNFQSFQKIHSERSFSGSGLRMFVKVYRNEASLWGQFLETIHIRSEYSESSPLNVPLHPFHPFSFPVRVGFKISGIWHSLSGFRPVLFLEPLPEKFPFPPVPIYQRKEHGFSMPYREAFLWWTGDLVRYEESEGKNVLVSSCTLTSKNGVSMCHVARLPDVLPGSKFRIVFYPGGKVPFSPKLDRAMRRVPGHFPIRFQGRRESHVLELRVVGRSMGIARGSNERDFRKSLGQLLSLKGFQVRPKGHVQKNRQKGLPVNQPDVLTVRIFPEKIRRSTIHSATIVLTKVPYDASVRNPMGELLWEKKGEMEGVGMGFPEARKDALDGLKTSVSRWLDADLWPIFGKKNGDDFFWTMRKSLLDGQAVCEKEVP